jgi:hypothetical protein
VCNRRCLRDWLTGLRIDDSKTLLLINKSVSDAGSKMKDMIKRTTTIISLVLLSSAVNFAIARDWDRDRDDDHRCRGDRRCVSAPEIDPAQALGALTLLGGTIGIVRGYRRRKK